jgi:hypothetical protein
MRTVVSWFMMPCNAHCCKLMQCIWTYVLLEHLYTPIRLSNIRTQNRTTLIWNLCSNSFLSPLNVQQLPRITWSSTQCTWKISVFYWSTSFCHCCHHTLSLRQFQPVPSIPFLLPQHEISFMHIYEGWAINGSIHLWNGSSSFSVCNLQGSTPF